MSVVREVAMVPQHELAVPHSRDCGFVQHLAKCGARKEGYIPVTCEQADALRALRRVEAPIRPVCVARQLGWSLGRATRWVRYFAAKGLLVATGKGHMWKVSA